VILLLGGTSETAPLANALADAGYRVLVSTATDVPLDTGSRPGIRRRAGPLDENAMVRLIEAEGIRAIVDGCHPYASQAHATAQVVAQRLKIPCLSYERPEAIAGDAHGDVLFTVDHAEAAQVAFAFGRPVLLTTGSRNL
jgi:precorrin-6A/cobalt-precorrin-6A reductase